MSKIELIEYIDPSAEAMVRQFHCAICDRAHLQTGRLARVWVGYATQAHEDCIDPGAEIAA